jgi:thioredoxin-like negative regulator of GroEL
MRFAVDAIVSSAVRSGPRRFLILLIAWIGFGIASPVGASVRWYDTVEGASATARELNKPMMLDFWADWCAACKVMEKEVYPSDQFARAAEPFVLVRIDADRKTDLSRKYKVTALPTLVFTDSYGNELFRYFGFMDTQPITQLLQSLPHDMTHFNRLSKVLAADKNNFEALQGMGQQLRGAGLYRASNDYYGKALQKKEAKSDPAQKESILSAMGANYLEVKEAKRAAETFERCLKEFPSSSRKQEWTAGLAQARSALQN